jgi:hypothetical protein
MKKLVLAIVIILGSNLAQAQSQLDTSDLFEGPLSEAIKGFEKPKVFTGGGNLDHSASIGRLKDIFSDSGEAFREIFGQMSEEFPGVLYPNDMEVPYIKLDDYYSKYIKNHFYDSTRYTKSDPKYTTFDDKLILIERESIYCYNSEGKNIRSIQITRFNREIVNVGDDSEELALYKK